MTDRAIRAAGVPTFDIGAATTIAAELRQRTIHIAATSFFLAEFRQSITDLKANPTGVHAIMVLFTSLGDFSAQTLVNAVLIIVRRPHAMIQMTVKSGRAFSVTAHT